MFRSIKILGLNAHFILFLKPKIAPGAPDRIPEIGESIRPGRRNRSNMFHLLRSVGRSPRKHY